MRREARAGLLLALCALGAQEVPPPTDPVAQARALRAEHHQLLTEETTALQKIAAGLESRKQPDAAARVLALVEPPDPADGPLHFVPFPEVEDGQTPRPALDAGVATDAEVPKLRAATASALFDLARRAAAPGTDRLGLAAECLRGVLDRDPDHAEARRLLGFVRHGEKGWATPQAAANLKAGMVLHDRFGWVPSTWVEHLDRNELPAPPVEGQPVRWLSVDQADALRSDFARRPWKIATEHFDVWSNVPLAEAIQFGRRLEALHDVFETVLADLVEPSASPLARRFREPGRWAEAEKLRHTVWYFAKKDEYVALARNRFGRDESISLGFYLDPRTARRFRQDPRSYFHRDPEQSLSALATLFHEASHQVLFETAGPTQYDQNIGQYWVWEGLGTYFETFRPNPDGSYTLGALEGPRLQKAIEEITVEHQLTPFTDLASMSSARFQDDQRVYSNYAQAMAWTVFFLHAGDARDRDAFLDYVRDAYKGRFRPSSTARKLPERLGRTGPQLDQELVDFLRRNAQPPGAGTAPSGY